MWRRLVGGQLVRQRKIHSVWFVECNLNQTKRITPRLPARGTNKAVCLYNKCFSPSRRESARLPCVFSSLISAACEACRLILPIYHRCVPRYPACVRPNTVRRDIWWCQQWTLSSDCAPTSSYVLARHRSHVPPRHPLLQVQRYIAGSRRRAPPPALTPAHQQHQQHQQQQ